MKFIHPLFDEYVIRIDNSDIFKMSITEAIDNGKINIGKDDKSIHEFVKHTALLSG